MKTAVLSVSMKGKGVEFLNLDLYRHAPRGWNSWDCYGASVTEETVRKNAEYMAKHLKSFGWNYIVVDIQWYEPTADSHAYHPFTPLCMDEFGRLMPAENRFPSAAGGKGFAPLAEYVHSLGLKFGIHIMRGIPRQAVHQNLPVMGTDLTARQIAKTDSICTWNTDMYGVDPQKEGARAYYDSIFKLYAQWGVDYIKCDDIAREFPHAKEEMQMLSDALRGCGREMLLSLSPGPAPLEEAEFLKTVGNMWRITDDFWDQWDLLYAMFERTEKWCIHTGAGHWPDADMLPIGAILQDYDTKNRTKFTQYEQITMMTLWSIFRSPLMIGGELTLCDDFTLFLLTHENILQMHENARHAHPLWRKEVDGNEIIAWMADSSEGGSYLAVFNCGEQDCDVTISLTELEMFSPVEAFRLWDGHLETIADAIHINVHKHGAEAYYLNEIR